MELNKQIQSLLKQIDKQVATVTERLQQIGSGDESSARADSSAEGTITIITNDKYVIIRGLNSNDLSVGDQLYSTSGVMFKVVKVLKSSVRATPVQGWPDPADYKSEGTTSPDLANWITKLFARHRTVLGPAASKGKTGRSWKNVFADHHDEENAAAAHANGGRRGKPFKEEIGLIMRALMQLSKGQPSKVDIVGILKIGMESDFKGVKTDSILSSTLYGDPQLVQALAEQSIVNPKLGINELVIRIRSLKSESNIIPHTYDRYRDTYQKAGDRTGSSAPEQLAMSAQAFGDALNDMVKQSQSKQSPSWRIDLAAVLEDVEAEGQLKAFGKQVRQVVGKGYGAEVARFPKWSYKEKSAHLDLLIGKGILAGKERAAFKKALRALSVHAAEAVLTEFKKKASADFSTIEDTIYKFNGDPVFKSAVRKGISVKMAAAMGEALDHAEGGIIDALKDAGLMSEKAWKAFVEAQDGSLASDQKMSGAQAAQTVLDALKNKGSAVEIKRLVEEYKAYKDFKEALRKGITEDLARELGETLERGEDDHIFDLKNAGLMSKKAWKAFKKANDEELLGSSR